MPQILAKNPFQDSAVSELSGIKLQKLFKSLIYIDLIEKQKLIELIYISKSHLIHYAKLELYEKEI